MNLVSFRLFQRLFTMSQWMILLFFASQFTAQQQVLPPLSREEKLLFDEAKRRAWHGEYAKSNESYEKLLKKRPDFPEASLRMAANFYSLGKYVESETLFQQVIEKNPDYDAEMYFSLAMVQADLKKFGAAADNYEKFACIEKNKPEKVKKALERKEIFRFRQSAVLNPVPYAPKNLGSAINTSYHEYSPWLSLDGSTLIFTRNEGQEDFYISRKDSLGFREAQPVFELNTASDEGTFSLSADGRMLVYTACNRKDLLGSCDLFYSVLYNGRWTASTNMGISVNSSAWESQPSLSADGNSMIFSSRRLGTRGGADLFYTFRDSTRAWVTPVNLGENINTAGDEESPFLHPDGHTLYFRSNGWPGMGGHDVFISRRNDSTGVWSKPVNLGYPINTEGSEGGFLVSLDGKTAYIATDVNPLNGTKAGQLDIYSFTLYPEARPVPTSFIQGIVKDGNTQNTLSANVRLVSLRDQNTVYRLTAFSDGTFFLPVPSGNSYACMTDFPGYTFQTRHIDVQSETGSGKKFELDILLYPIPQTAEEQDQLTNDKIVLENVFFNLNSAILTPESELEIHQLFTLLRKQPELHIIITGHTDNSGDESINLPLSLARAKAVADALLKKGITPGRITTEGKGSSVPVDTNDSSEGRKKNRRTEFSLYLPKTSGR